MCNLDRAGGTFDSGVYGSREATLLRLSPGPSPRNKFLVALRLECLYYQPLRVIVILVSVGSRKETLPATMVFGPLTAERWTRL